MRNRENILKNPFLMHFHSQEYSTPIFKKIL